MLHGRWQMLDGQQSIIYLSKIYLRDSITTAPPAKASKITPKRQIQLKTCGKRPSAMCEEPKIAARNAAKVNPHIIQAKYLKTFKINLNRGLYFLVVMALSSDIV
ncbi:MAG: hypothetical protein AAF378_23225 [Cyanobacteria bacterium P01_A01_bin.84]